MKWKSSTYFDRDDILREEICGKENFNVSLKDLIF
jgi:hypothetical protein